MQREVLCMHPCAAAEIKAENADHVNEIRILKNNRLIMNYVINGKKQEPTAPSVCPPLPKDCKSCEDLYLYGLHIEQYRHATYNAEDYYLEGLRRDDTDIRLNNAYGKLLLKRGLFVESETYFRKAVEKSVRSNPNPYDSEPYLNLGVSLLYQGRLSESYDALYKATWSSACAESAFYHLACICAQKREYGKALEHIENSLIKNARNYRSMDLKALILQKLGKQEEAVKRCEETLSLDPMDMISLRICGKMPQIRTDTAIEIALEYKAGGFYEDAIRILEEDDTEHPMVHYHLADLYRLLGDQEKAELHTEKAESASSYLCFPHRLPDMTVLEKAAEYKESAMANYYLGCLYYDKKRYEDAVACWEKTVKLKPDFPTAHRNLGLAYFNKHHNAQKALNELETAFALDKTDGRVLMELDQLHKKMQMPPQQRLSFLGKYMDLVCARDDLYIEYITLLNLTGRYAEALSALADHKFHSWEGGEGKAPRQYVFALCAMAKAKIDSKEYADAIALLERTFTYPENLGEGKLFGAQENLQNLLLGIAYERSGEPAKANEYFVKASIGLSQPQSAVYYNDQPPETIFCQGLALLKLGKANEADLRFDRLIEYADQHMDDEIKIDYFAVSLPDFLVFDEDLNKQNKVHCLFMKALGLFGKKDHESASQTLGRAYALDTYHFGMNSYRILFMNKGESI